MHLRKEQHVLLKIGNDLLPTQALDLPENWTALRAACHSASDGHSIHDGLLTTANIHIADMVQTCLQQERVHGEHVHVNHVLMVMYEWSKQKLSSSLKPAILSK